MTQFNSPSIATWIEKESSAEAWAYLACHEQIMSESSYAAIDVLLRKLYVEEEICYLSATDAYAVVEISASGGCVSLPDYENILISFAVDRNWAIFTQTQEGFVWVIISGALTLEQVSQATMPELIDYREQEEIELISVSTFNSNQDQQTA